MEEIKNRLKELGITDEAMADKIISELGLTEIGDLTQITEDDLKGLGMKPIQARKLIAALAPAPAAKAPAAADVVNMNAISFDSVLPAVPTDESWLESLRTGGVLKVGQSTVISAIRAALAYKAGLFGIPELLVEKMEAFADSNEEQVDAEFYKIRKSLTRRSYADIFAAIEGLESSYVTETRKKQLFQRIDAYLWPSIAGFFEQLKSWQESWMQGAANPAIMMGAFMAASGSGAGMMPPGMMQPPETGALRDYADSVADAINKVFAGTGVQIASALAYDATEIRKTMTSERLPALIGAANRDQMLRQLGVSVSATYPRLETNLTRFVLGVIQAKDQPAGNEELRYFGALFMLGSQIPWSELSTSSVTGNRKRPSGIGEKL